MDKEWLNPKFWLWLAIFITISELILILAIMDFFNRKILGKIKYGRNNSAEKMENF